MPHQRKYVAHSGGIAAWPSRAKRSMVAYASHGFSSRLSRSARCALLSFTSLTLASAETHQATDLASVHPAFVFACDLSPRPTRAHCTYRCRHHDRNYIFLIGIVKNRPRSILSIWYYWIYCLLRRRRRARAVTARRPRAGSPTSRANRGGDGSSDRRRRSEERRVGKECRSRWSP